MIAELATLPEQGNLVEVRRRRWIVSDVQASSLGSPSTSSSVSALQHLVDLVSVEDDAFDERLHIIWEIEPGARVIEDAGLPDLEGFDPPRYHRALLNAVRWGAIANADIQALQSPFRSGIEIEDYQLDPVVRALDMPRVNLLLADDVGLGKTIEAGLVIQELLLRHRARTVVVACPASLQIKWQDEMREKFGLEFRILDTELLRNLRRTRGIHANPWTHFPRLIVSIDWLKRDQPMRMFRETVPSGPSYPRKYDILVVDEAHNVAPSGSGSRTVDSQRTTAIRTIAQHFEHRLFLTATPHNGYQHSFTALLELIDDQRFARGMPLDQDQLGTIMVRRLKEEITDPDGNPRFPPRRVLPIEVEYTTAERHIYERLTAYQQSRKKNAADEGKTNATEFVLKLLKKRLFSSPEAFASTLDKHFQSLSRAPTQNTTTERSSKMSLGIFDNALQDAEEDYSDDDKYEEALDNALDTAASLMSRLTEDERALLDEMKVWAESARVQSDSKASALFRWLESNIRPDGHWSDKRVIIFTEYRATQKWLIEQLTNEGFGGTDRLMALYGGMDTQLRENIKAAFQASPSESSVRILVATDSASEGIDLQNHCHNMVHMEIPWNPNRLEQRNGRIDRHGQRADEVLIHHFVPSGYQESDFDSANPGGLEGDLEFLMRVARKIDAIRRDLGRVGPVIASQVEEAMLGKRNSLDTVSAEREAGQIGRMLRVDREFRQRLAHLNERLDVSRKELQVNPGTIREVIDIGLEIAEQPALVAKHGNGTKDMPEKNGHSLFNLPALRGTWAECASGLNHPHTGRKRPITFDGDLAKGRDDMVLVHLSHRLTDRCCRLLRAEMWAPVGQRRLNRFSTSISSDPNLESPVVMAHARLIVQGRGGHRLHEELVFAGGSVSNGRFRRLNVSELESVYSASVPQLVDQMAVKDLSATWPNLKPSLLGAIEARTTDRMRSLDSTLERRCQREISDISKVLMQLKATIEAELKTPEFEQLQLWESDEDEQRERYGESLKRRAESIPQEIENESKAIRARFEDPSAKTFPVTVTFILPEKMV